MKTKVNTMVCYYAKVLITVRRRKELLRQTLFHMLQAAATPSICTEIPLTRVVVARYRKAVICSALAFAAQQMLLLDTL